MSIFATSSASAIDLYWGMNNDTLGFGTKTNGLATGTIAVSGRVPSAGNYANMPFGSASGVITFSGGSNDWLVTGNHGINLQNVQSAGAAPGVIFNANVAAASLNSNGSNDGYIQFNSIYAATSQISLTRGIWEHTGSSYLTDSMTTPTASFSQNISLTTGGTFDLDLGAGFSYANTYEVLSDFGGTNSASWLFSAAAAKSFSSKAISQSRCMLPCGGFF